MTDWNQEAEAIGSSDFWKPDTGQYKVKFLDNGTPTEYEGKPQMEFKVEVNGEGKLWTITKAKTVNSLWGQLVLVARYHGTLENKEITLFVKFDQANNKREYTIQEALPLIDEWNKQQEQKKNQPKEAAPQAGAAPSLLDEIFQKQKN